MQLGITAVKQIAPITATVAKVQVSFDLSGTLPDFVQIYAVTATASGPSNLIATVDMKPPTTQYDEIIALQAGTYYTLYICPRTGSEGTPDDQIDGVYWETYCAVASITTQAVSSSPGGNLPPPTITHIIPYPATIKQDSSMTIEWSAFRQYNKFLVWWTQNGIALAQGEINTTGSSGTWSVQTTPGYHYTFKVEGGVSAGLSGYDYSGWGPEVSVVAPANLNSLKQYLQNSGLHIANQSLRALMPTGTTLRQFMKL